MVGCSQFLIGYVGKRGCPSSHFGPSTEGYVKVESFVILFKALGSEERIKILKILEQGCFYVNDIQHILGMENQQPTVSKHLNTLRGVGLIDYERRKRMNIYYLRNPDDLNEYERTMSKFVGLALKNDPKIKELLGRIRKMRLALQHP